MANANSILMIHPYRERGVWVFDDTAKQLEREPFVGEINRMIDALTADIPDAVQGFRLLFSSKPFPGFRFSLQQIRREYDGTWYRCNELDSEGWLCPALLKYFDTPPAELYVRGEAAQP